MNLTVKNELKEKIIIFYNKALNFFFKHNIFLPMTFLLHFSAIYECCVLMFF